MEHGLFCLSVIGGMGILALFAMWNIIRLGDELTPPPPLPPARARYRDGTAARVTWAELQSMKAEYERKHDAS